MGAPDAGLGFDLLVDQALQVGQAPGPDLEQIGELAGDAMALLDLAQGQGVFDEGPLVARAFHLHMDKGAHHVTEPLRIDEGDVGADIATGAEFLQALFDSGD